ncbi:DUF2339 domain-containing protein [Gordonia hydrophobica]|uniref:DUF2339 domain-containing protein n=1 Tax=Gordonia hydrophobica TaxID=40516 RepID=A0ABZ2U6F6_9ACTN|nr:DUF2339 domain-containing protein [Gordonia hydrophobica]MBM7365492.1 putative membrane protein [Gordonia hydrophobica]
MNTNIDPAVAAARLGDELSRIAGQMSAVSDDFAVLAERFATTTAAPADRAAAAPEPTTTAPVPAPRPATPQPTPIRQFPTQAPPPPQPQPQPQHQPQPQLQYATGVHVASAPFGPPPPHGPRPAAPWTPYPAPPRPRPKAPSFGERLSDAAERGVVGRVLAAVGVGITLIGIVLLLVLAAQAGLLRPEVRVAGGAAIAAALVAAGCWIGRREEKRSGALALVATGVAAALFDVLAATSIYHWLPEIAALVVGGAIAAGGLYVAHRWSSQTLGLMVSIPMLVFAPIAAGGVDSLLVCFLLVYASTTLWIQVGRDWTALFVVNTVATTFPLMVLAAFPADTAPWLLVVAGVVNLVLALGSAVVLSASSSKAVILGVSVVVTGLPLPIMAGGGALERPTATAVVALGSVLFVLAALGTRGRTSIPFVCRAVWLTGAAVLSALSLGIALQGDTVPLGFLSASIVVIVGSRWGDDLTAALRVVASVFGVLGLLTLLALGGAEQVLTTGSSSSTSQATLLIGALLGIAATTLVVRELGEHHVRSAQQFWLLGGVIDLWLITVLCVSVGKLAADGGISGFRAGHLAATLIWFGAAAAGLLWARTLHGSARSLALATGLAVLAAAVAKLFLFDLAALAGVFRVIAFIVAGLVLLALGVAYAQSLSSDENRAQQVGPAPQ